MKLINAIFHIESGARPDLIGIWLRILIKLTAKAYLNHISSSSWQAQKKPFPRKRKRLFLHYGYRSADRYFHCTRADTDDIRSGLHFDSGCAVDTYAVNKHTVYAVYLGIGVAREDDPAS